MSPTIRTVLARLYWVSFDNGKKSMVSPDYQTVGRGRFYYYLEGSLVLAAQRFISVRADHSKELCVGYGDDSASEEARARWGHFYRIPAVRQDELDGFLAGRRRGFGQYGDMAKDPPVGQRCPDEQYEIHMRNLLDFDDWEG